MGIDAFSSVAPAYVRCLLLPCGKITRSRFSTFVERLQQENTIRLGDVSPNAGQHRNMFSPLAFPTGMIVYYMSTSVPSAAHLSLTPFELYREPLLVVGIADALEHLGRMEQDSELRSTSPHEKAALDDVAISELLDAVLLFKEQYHSAFVHQILVFDCDEPITAEASEIVAVPSRQKSTSTTMKTIMCDLTSHLLGEMTSYARSLQALPNIETPKPAQKDLSSGDFHPIETSEPNVIPRAESRISNTAGSHSTSPAPDLERSRNRSSVHPHVSPAQTNGIDERSRSRPRVDGSNTPPLTFDQTNGLAESTIETADKDKGRRLSRDRVAVHGFGSGTVGERARNKAKGRIGVVLGSLYLLAGRWPDAIRELVGSATVARANSDHVWHAKALDYILVSLLMCAWAGMDFEVPQICYPSGDKSSPHLSKSAKHTPSSSTAELTALKSPNAANRLVSLQNLCALLPDLINNILHLYIRAATFTADIIPQLSFSDSAIRFAKLLTIIEGTHGLLDDQGLQLVVLNANSSAHSSLVASNLASFPTKSDVAALVLRAIPSPSMEHLLDMKDRINIYAGIASVLARLGYHRKKAFIMREILLFLLPALIQSRKDSAAELGVHPAASLSSFDLAGTSIVLAEHLGSIMGPDNGIQSFLRLVNEVYGVVQSAEHAVAPDPSAVADITGSNLGVVNVTTTYDTSEAIAKYALQSAVTRSFGNHILKIEVLRASINICEALPDLRGVLRFSSDLLRTAGSGIAPGPKSIDASPTLPIEDQARLVNNVSRAVSAARKFEVQDAEADYWDDFLVRSIEVSKLPALKSPICRHKANLNFGGSGKSEAQAGPFIYNPFLTKPTADTTEPLVVAGEEVRFSVLCQNLYNFDLEIEWIRLDTGKIVLDTLIRSVVIGPYRTQLIHLHGTPMSAGVLRIEGCIAKVKGCRERRFPIFEAAWADTSDVKLKNVGLSAATLTIERPMSSTSDTIRSQRPAISRLPAPTTLVINVIESQPTVIVKATSLSQSAIMLLEGETRSFTVTMRNISSTTPVDLLFLTFTDSTSSVLQSALANKDLSQAELYEVELASYRRETLKWRRHDGNEEHTIGANDEITVDIEVVGKPGLTNGVVHIDYGYVGVPKSEIPDHFYTRQVVLTFTITVNASIDLVRNDFLPFTGDFAWQNQQRQINNSTSVQSTPPEKRSRATSRLTFRTENRFQSLLERLGLGTQGSDHCLLLLDFHNAWPKPITVSVQVREKTTVKDPSPSDLWKRAYTVHEVIQPGQTSRLVLLLPLISLSKPFAQVPSLNPATKRQFIHSSRKSYDPETERNAREAFWLREEILKLMRASWTEDATGRAGEVELRSLRLTARMIEAIKLEEVAIEFTISADPISSLSPSTRSFVTQLASSRFRTAVDSFLTLTTTITNRLQHPIEPLLRLQPSVRHQPYNVALDLGRKFAFNGVMQQSLPTLHPGESRQIQMGISLLARGEFEIRASVEELRAWKGRSAKSNDSIEQHGGAETEDIGMEGLLERKERRIWHAKENCIVYVVDEVDTHQY